MTPWWFLYLYNDRVSQEALVKSTTDRKLFIEYVREKFKREWENGPWYHIYAEEPEYLLAGRVSTKYEVEVFLIFKGEPPSRPVS